MVTPSLDKDIYGGLLPSWARDPRGRFSDKPNAMRFGALFNVAGAAVQLLASFIGMTILARFVPHEAFSTYGLIFPIVSTLMIFSDGGSIYIILREKRPDAEVIIGLLWICIYLALILFGVAVIITFVFSRLYSNPYIFSGGIILSGGILAQGAMNVHTALIVRCFRNGLWLIAQISGVTLALLVSVGLALKGAGIFALVCFLVVRVGTTAVTTWVLSGWSPGRPHLSGRALKQLRGLGLWELFGRGVTNAAREADKFAAVLLLSPRSSGLYVIAHMFAVTAARQAIAPLLSLFMPYLVELRDNLPLYNRRLLEFVGLFVGVLGPVAFWIGFVAGPLLALLTGIKDPQLADTFVLLVLGAVMGVAGQIINLGIQAVDRPDVGAVQAGFLFICIIAGLIFSVVFAGDGSRLTGIHVALGSIFGLLVSLCLQFQVLIYMRQVTVLEAMRILWFPLVSFVMISATSYGVFRGISWLGSRESVGYLAEASSGVTMVALDIVAVRFLWRRFGLLRVIAMREHHE